jgi:iron complex transport system substrate-binding protein
MFKRLFFVLTFILFLNFGQAQNSIISLAPNITEIICYLGGEQRLKGITNDCNYPSSIKKITKVGKYTFPDLEKIVALQPATVIAESSADKRFLAKLKNCNIPYQLYNFRELNLFFTELYKLDKNLKLNGVEKIKKLEKIYKHQQQKYRNKKIIIVLWQEPYICAGKDVFLSQYFEHLGFKNCLSGIGYPQLDLERVYRCDPDYLVNLSGKKFTKLKKAQLIEGLNPDIMLRLTPRLIEYYEKLSF